MSKLRSKKIIMSGPRFNYDLDRAHEDITIPNVQVVTETNLGAVTPVVEGKSVKTLLKAEESEIKDHSNQNAPADETGGVVTIPLSLINPYSYQALRVFNQESLKELSEDIKERGLQIPIKVVQVGDQYEVTCGERRVRASRLAGLASIKAVVEKDGKQAIINSFQDNEKRENYCYVEKALFWKRLLDEGMFLSIAELAKTLKVDPSEISRSNLLKELTDDEVDMLVKEKAGRWNLEKFVKAKRARADNPNDKEKKVQTIKIIVTVNNKGKFQAVNGIDNLDLEMAKSFKEDLERYIERIS